MTTCRERDRRQAGGPRVTLMSLWWIQGSRPALLSLIVFITLGGKVSGGQRVESREQRAEKREQRAESREQRAEKGNIKTVMEGHERSCDRWMK